MNLWSQKRQTEMNDQNHRERDRGSDILTLTLDYMFPIKQLYSIFKQQVSQICNRQFHYNTPLMWLEGCSLSQHALGGRKGNTLDKSPAGDSYGQGSQFKLLWEEKRRIQRTHKRNATVLNSHPQAQSLQSMMLTVGVQLVTRHLWWSEALLEGVSVVAIVLHGHQLMMVWR